MNFIALYLPLPVVGPPRRLFRSCIYFIFVTHLDPQIRLPANVTACRKHTRAWDFSGPNRGNSRSAGQTLKRIRDVLSLKMTVVN